MKTASETVAYNLAKKQIADSCFVSRHACKLDARSRLLWYNDKDIEAGIQTAQIENSNE